jgi:hypothetical protein
MGAILSESDRNGPKPPVTTDLHNTWSEAVFRDGAGPGSTGGDGPGTTHNPEVAGSNPAPATRNRPFQVVVVETGGRPVVIGGDMAVWFGELDEPQTEGQLLVRALDPELVWLAHEHEPWRPSPPEPGSTR